MIDPARPNEFLHPLAQVLIRSFIIGAVMLLVTLVFLLLVSNLAYSVHSSYFDITRQQFDIIMYCGLGLMKIMLFVFFLIPYIAIRLVLAKNG